jgi:hypothetical protein
MQIGVRGMGASFLYDSKDSLYDYGNREVV